MNTTIPPDMNITSAPTPGNNTTNTTFAPTMAPNVAPTEAPIPPGGPITRQQININFLVSNLETNPKLVDPNDVNTSGLQLAWPSFVADSVADTTAARTFTTGTIGEGGRRLRQTAGTHQQRRRRLAVNLEAGSEYIYDIVLIQCPTEMGPVHEDLTCHDVYGTYTLALQGDENARLVEQEYGMATATAIMEGKLEETMQELDSGTPLFIGTVAPPGSDDNGMPVWLMVLIILLCILICLCIMAAIFFFRNKQQNDDDDKAAAAGEPYDEDGFAYDFLVPPNQKPQTEVDDDDPDEAGSKDVEEFGDEEMPVVEGKEETAIIDEEEHSEDGGEEEDGEWDQPDKEIEEEEKDDEEEAEEEQDESENDSDEESPRPDTSEEFGEQNDPDGVRGSTGPQSGSDSDNNMEESAEFETADELEGESEGEDDWDDENPGETDEDWDDEDEGSNEA